MGHLSVIPLLIGRYILEDIGCFGFFATHFHELTRLNESFSSCFNLQVTAQTTSDEITFLYQVKPGVCDDSFGIHVAKLTKFPSYIINLANLKVKELEGHFEDLNLSQGEKEEVNQFLSQVIEGNAGYENSPSALNRILNKMESVYCC